MFKKRKGREVAVTPAGFIHLFRLLHNATGLYEFTRGVTVTAFTQSNGNFLVRLTPWQVDALMEMVPAASIEFLAEAGANEEEVKGT